LVTAFLECMKAADQLTSTDEARLALRGFIFSRRRSVLEPILFASEAGDALVPSELSTLISDYVQDDSEGGRRAQACAAAILDAACGSEGVVVGGIYDPDRRAPLDVALRGGDGEFLIALEVKDKPIDESSVMASIEKTVRDHGLRTMAFIAVSRSQRQLDQDAITRWCNQRGVRVVIFYNWSSFLVACKFRSSADGRVFEGLVFRQLLVRGQQLNVDRVSLERIAARG
jgi:hypothetical protein